MVRALAIRFSREGPNPVCSGDARTVQKPLRGDGLSCLLPGREGSICHMEIGGAKVVDSSMKRVMIVDALNAYFRAFIVNPSLSTHGQPIGGLKGFLGILQKRSSSRPQSRRRRRGKGAVGMHCSMRS